jgi:3-isopropylmalate dehydratase small subunit
MISADVPQSAQAYKSSRNSAAAFLLRYRFASVFSATFHHIFIHPEDLNLTIFVF